MIKNIPAKSNKVEAPEQVQLGVHIRDDLKWDDGKKKSIKVICEDNDVFGLLFHCYDLQT